MNKLPIYIPLLLLLSCAKEDSQAPNNQPSNITPSYTLTASAGEGGSVTGGGTFASGTEVSLTATPNPGYQFTSWSNGSTSNPVTITLNSNTGITANFEVLINSYTLTVLSTDGGSASGAGDYNEGTEVTLTATASEGYFFSGWEGVDEDEETISLTVNSDIEITATFLSLPSLDVIDNVDTPDADDFKIYTKSQQGDLEVSFSSEGGFESLNITSSYGSVNYTQPNEGELGGEILINYTALKINNPNTDITIAGEDYLEFELTDLYGNIITKSVTLKTQPEPIFKDYLKSSHDNQASRLNLLDFYEIRHREGKADRFFCDYVEQTPGLYQDFFLSVGIIDINGDGYEDFVIPPSFTNGEWTSRKTEYEAYVYKNGEYKFTEEVWRGYVPMCYLARKALVADFDGDGDGDIYFACTGMDLDPYPRERETSWLLINEGDGTLGLKEIDEFMSSHDITAADFDGDGDIDIFSIGYIPNRSDGFHVGILENIGGNNFVRKETFSGNTHNSFNEFYFSNVLASEAADINNDGYMDVVWGGNEYVGLVYGQFMGYPRIELGNPTGKFNTDQSIFIPSVEGFGIILGIDFYDIDGDGILEIILNRTGDNLNENGEINVGFGFNEQIGETYYYGGYYIQVVKLINNQAIDITNQYIEDNFYRAFSDGCDPQSDWMRWLVIQDYDNDGKIDLFNPLIYLFGEGHESLRRWEWNGLRFIRINP